MANSTKDSAVFKVAADIAEPQKAIAEINALVKKMADNVNTSSVIGVKAFRSEADAARELLKQLGASDRQMGDLVKTTQRVESQAAAHLSRIGGAARTMASGFEAMARTGNIAGEATKQIVAQGSELAFTFGAAGPIVGALGIAGLALFNFFDRARKEMEETKKKAISDVLALASSLDAVKSGEALRNLTSGNVDARLLVSQGRLNLSDLTPEQLGIQGLKERIAQRTKQAGTFTAVGTGPGGHTMDPNADLRRQIKEDEKALAQLIKQRADVEVLYTAALARTNGMAQVGVELAKSAADQKEREKAAQQAMARSASDLVHNAKAEARNDAATRAVFGQQDAAVGTLLPTLARPRPAFDRVSTADAAASGRMGLDSVQLPDLWTRIAASIKTADDAQLDFANNIASVTTASVQAFGAATVQSFLLVAEGGKLSGKAFGEAVLTGVEQAAASKAIFYLGEGLAAIATALIPGGQSAGPAAGFYFKAAGIMAAIAGGAGALGGNAAGGRSGGGGTSGASGNISMGRTFSAMDRGTGTITIIGDPYLDTGDVRKMDALAGALRSLDGRDITIRHA